MLSLGPLIRPAFKDKCSVLCSQLISGVQDVMGHDVYCSGTEGSGSASVKPRAGARSWMFWKSSASSSLLEGELDAEASSPPAVGRSRRSAAAAPCSCHMWCM